MQTAKISNHKIIVFIAFICAALMASLFIYHSGKKTSSTTLDNDQALVFPVARDLKPFELAGTEPFTQKSLLNHWTLMFFGFTHCSNVCPTTLSMLQTAYDELRPQYPNLQVVLVSLDPERDSISALKKYTNNFHTAFIGTTGKLQELRKLQAQLGIFSAKEAADAENNYQLQHTSSILLINPQGKWAGLFKYGMQSKQFVTAFKESVTKLENRV